MIRSLALVCFVSFTTFAQGEPLPVSEPVHAAVPVPPPLPTAPSLPDWNIGAGIGLNIAGLGLSDLAGSTAGLAALGGLGAAVQPRMTILIERRLSEQLFLSFQASASYGASQSDTYSAISYRHLNLEGGVGLRRVFNPRGVIEVSLFGNAAVAYNNFEIRSLVNGTDSMGMTTQVPQKLAASAFAVGAVAGLTLERELIAGLALRLSSSVLGFSYGVGSAAVEVSGNTAENANHGVDVGLRFNPSIEIRYAF